MQCTALTQWHSPNALLNFPQDALLVGGHGGHRLAHIQRLHDLFQAVPIYVVRQHLHARRTAVRRYGGRVWGQMRTASRLHARPRAKFLLACLQGGPCKAALAQATSLEQSLVLLSAAALCPAPLGLLDYVEGLDNMVQCMATTITKVHKVHLH